MILVGNQRGGGKDLASHLLKEENERVVVHQVRGFASNDLHGAFQESYAMSKGTRCKQHLFSLSLNPPIDESVDSQTFEDAVDRAEETLGLTGQPRAIVFHEKLGRDGEVRRHAHAVWCRIDTENMKAVHLSFSKKKLNDLGRDLYLEHGWQMPRGFVRHEEASPRNYTLAEWQQAKRAEKDPDRLKAMFQDCWAISDSQAAFTHALKERGFILARGDRRGVVAVDRHGEVYAISRWVGIKAKQVGTRIRDTKALPDTGEAQKQATQIVIDRLQELKAIEERKAKDAKERFKLERRRLSDQHRKERERLQARQSERARQEEHQRKARIRTGWRGLIDYLTGRRRAAEDRSRQEKLVAEQRDMREANKLTSNHQTAKKRLDRTEQKARRHHLTQAKEADQDIQKLETTSADRGKRKIEFKNHRASRRRIHQSTGRTICSK